MATDVLDVIRTKRDGGALSDEQIRFFIEGYTAGTIADEQAAALCMAILLRDMRIHTRCKSRLAPSARWGTLLNP